MTTHKVVKHDEWLKARRRHLAKEKEFTRLRDQLSRERRELPWELVEKHYTFEGEHGRQTLSDLFEGRGQLVIYHAMFNPDTAGADTTWTADAACFVCSFWMDPGDRLQLPAAPVGIDRGTRHQRVREGRWSDLPHVLHL